MLVQNSVYRNTYLTDGVNKDFYFSFPILEASQVLVQTSLLTNTDVVTTVDPSQYTVTGVGQTTGGHISFTTAPPTGSRIALTLNIPITQLYQYAELDSFPAKSHEDALAKLTLICQQLKEQISRTVTLPPTSSESPETVVASIYASRDAAAVSASAASNKADAAEASAQAAANSATTAAQSAAEAAAASSGLAPRVDAVEMVAASAKAVTDLATDTPGAGKIPLADANGKLDAWVTETPIAYATSSTDGSTAEKVASTTGTFTLHKGARVFVIFANSNTVADALSLNVNGTGAKPIYNEFGAVSSSNPMGISAGIPTEFIYDGTNWTYQAAGGAYDYIGSAFRNLQAGSSINGSVVGSGVGSFCSLYANNSTGFTLPAGGTWFVFYFGANGSGNVEWTSGRSYVMAGGSVVPVVSWSSNGFAIRIK